MSTSGKRGEINKKAYELVYALSRISVKILDQNISRKISELGIELLVATLACEYEDAGKYLEAVDYLVKLSIDLGAITFLNGDVLMGEIGNLSSMLTNSADPATEAVDIRDFFSSAPPGNSRAENARDVSVEEIVFESMRPQSEQEVEIAVSEPGSNESGNPANNFLKSGIRQMAVLDKIRQSGNCRMRDIQEVLPNTSERTIRYDLEDLIERKLIERIGAGGPAISYRIRQS